MRPDDGGPLREEEDLASQRRELEEVEDELAELQGRPPPARLESATAPAQGYRAPDPAAERARVARELDARLASVKIDLSIERAKREPRRTIGLRTVVLGALAFAPAFLLYWLFRDVFLSGGAALLCGFGLAIWRVLEAGDGDARGGPGPSHNG